MTSNGTPGQFRAAYTAFYMTTLAAVLVRQRALPLETVEQAMLRQSLFGGDLTTNLLELGSLDEQALLNATATALEVKALPSGRITVHAPDLIGLFPAAQLLEHPFLPFSNADAEVVVVAAAPLPTALLEEIGVRFDKPVVLLAALEVRIRQAIAAELGQTLDDRTVKLLARLDGMPAPASQQQAVDTPPPSSGVPTPRVSLPAAAMRSLLPRRSASKPHGQPRRLGPFTASMAEIELTSAQSPGDVIAIWLDFAAQYFDYTAIFAVQGDLAAGKSARGNGTVGEAFARIGVPLDLPSALQRARSAGSWLLTALEPRGLDRSLARDLGRNAGRQVLMLPISIKQRVVLLTYGDHGQDNVLLERVGDVLALQPLVERHLERMLVERKRGGKSLQPTATGNAPAHEPKAPSLPKAHDRTNALTEAPTAAAAQPATASSEAPYAPVASRPSNEPLTDPHEGRTVPAPATPFDIGADARTALDTPGAMTNIDTGDIDESWDIIQPVLSVGDGESARLTRTATNNPSAQARDSSPPGSVWPGSSSRPSLSPKLELVPDSENNEGSSPQRPEGNTPMLPFARAEAHPPREAVRGSVSGEMTLPTVVVDCQKDCLDLLERFKQGDETALDQLIEMGDAAVGVLVGELPGPISTPSRVPRMEQSTKASDFSPLLKALVAFGPVARPYVIARTSDSDPKVRVWSTRLLGELTGRQAAIAVAQRIVMDRDAEVRRAAYLASHQLLREPDSALALRQALLSTAGDRQAVITQRLAAIDAIADLRDAPAIPYLIELLADPNPGTAAAAQQSLTVLARQDFGYDAKTWMTWWNNNASRDRIEWVIDALDHRSPAVRQAASEELRLISRLYVGNVDDDSLDARAKVQKKYREWWATGDRSTSGRPARS